MQEIIHRSQFSTGFDGWQLASNGMHVLPYIDDTQEPKDRRMRELHNFVQPAYNDLIIEKTDSGKHVTAAFIWQSHFPLKQYLYRYMQTTQTPYLIAWSRLGSGLFADYGKWLILHYPAQFWKYYLSLNIKGVFYPQDLEMVGHYSVIPKEQKVMHDWFGVDLSHPQDSRYAVYEQSLRPILPIIELLTWLLFASAVVLIFVYRQKTLANRNQRLAFALLFAFGFIYYGTTAFAAPIVIRYWLPMHVIKLAFVWMIASPLLHWSGKAPVSSL